MQYFKFFNFAKSKPDLVETNCKFMFPKPGSDGFLLNITDTPSLEYNLKKKCDGLVGTFKSYQDRFSYAKIKNDLVIETAEKKVISNNALSGLYMFSDPYLFYEVGNDYIYQKKKIKNEYYIAPIYNDLIKMKKKIITDEVDNIDILGTPEEVDLFKNNE